MPSLFSSGEIDASLVTVVENNATITLAAESTFNAEVETLPFNFSTSQRTCICRVQLTASSWEYPLNFITLGILSLPVRSGYPLHATNSWAAFLARSSAPFFLDDIVEF